MAQLKGFTKEGNPLRCILKPFLFWFPGLPGTSELSSPCIRNRNTQLHYKERTDNFALLWRPLMAQAQEKQVCHCSCSLEMGRLQRPKPLKTPEQSPVWLGDVISLSTDWQAKLLRGHSRGARHHGCTLCPWHGHVQILKIPARDFRQE